MTEEQRSKANEIAKKIKRLDDFIFTAERLWKGKLAIFKPRMIFHIHSYGAFHGSEIELDTAEKDALLSVLISERDSLKKKLEEI